MSSTVTTTQTASTFSRGIQSGVLDDYELKHSGGDESSSSTLPETARHIPPRRWDTAHRRVPPYRATNTTRDPSETRVYLNSAEQIFIGTMFTGVYINSTASKLWHGTLGRLNGNIFRYKIGGEF